MDIILKDDVKGLGFKNEVVQVKPGFGRNYLIPQGLGTLATPGARKMMAENMRQAAHKQEKIKKDAEQVAGQIGDLTLEIAAKAGENGRIFGSVTPLQIADALRARGIEVDRRKISFEGDVKNLGEYHAVIQLHKEVQHRVRFNVVSE